jgi:hypothetical protein
MLMQSSTLRATAWCARSTYGELDSGCGVRGGLVLPDSDDLPSRISESSIRIAVAALVRVDLLAPPFGVGLRPAGVIGASVPEASVDEDSDALRRKRKVRSAPHARKRPIDPIPKAPTVQN